MKIVFYIPHFNNIGGVESWIYYISKLYGKNRDITVYYKTGDEKQIDRLRDLVKVRKFYNQSVKCDIAIFCMNMPDSDIICFDASKERIQFVHACYSIAYHIKSFKTNPLINRYIAVSQTAANDFYKLTGTMPEIMYNPVYLEKPRKVLKIISATRIAEDKGSIYEKMKIFARKLIEENIPFIWLVFTNNTDIKPDIKGFVFMPSELNISNYIAEADYLAQFSKTEADCLAVKESLSLGTPVLATNFDAAIENGVVDGKTGYIFNMDMSNIDVDKIYNNIPKFNYKVKNSDEKWKKLLGEEQENIREDNLVHVQCTYQWGFEDYEYNVFRKKGDKWYTDYERAMYLTNYKLEQPEGFTIIKLIDIIE
jgi:glycosyltransferase involved in cell wall biosynthesis